MSNGWLFLGFTTLICLGAFLNGRRFARMSMHPWAGKTIGRFPVKGSELSLSSVQRIGRVQMIAAPIFWLFFCALSFGLLGPVDGIHTISF